MTFHPLRDVRVIDMGLLLPGPVCALHLAWLGADVLKVEPPHGDAGRVLYDGAFFDTYNRGKRSIAIDLKTEQGRAVFLDLADQADILIENFRPGVAERLGIGAGVLQARNPRLIYCAITGFGSGSRASAPAHDLNFLARSGALGLPTTWSGQGRQSTRPAMPIADFGGAAMAVQAILAALFERTRTGNGARIEIAMQEVMLHWIGWRTSADERADERAWTRHLEPANDLYLTADGRGIAIGAIESHLWRGLVAALEDAGAVLPPGAMDWDWQARRIHAQELSDALAIVFAARPLAEWLERLEAAGVPADPVNTPPEAFADPWAIERKLVGDDGWIRPPLPGVGALSPAPAVDADGPAVRQGMAWKAPPLA
ncbi:CaiB/BaiF CoA transferase family protein [Sphingomonas colocasiae]|uniref:CoA transferase n=1 Tax=Sphingomonas colocasiae TaxID=1848973 RepID=A0ABS7PK79_9SPHN|nr:CaiB/BaiF CoA-transferase family protein [Sphingomonas colocasiae]MBY8821691.1 CoA transferase [Sphingomonas colocasiae]